MTYDELQAVVDEADARFEAAREALRAASASGDQDAIESAFNARAAAYEVYRAAVLARGPRIDA